LENENAVLKLLTSAVSHFLQQHGFKSLTEHNYKEGDYQVHSAKRKRREVDDEESPVIEAEQIASPETDTRESSPTLHDLHIDGV
jgi:hypothetical protein